MSEGDEGVFDVAEEGVEGSVALKKITELASDLRDTEGEMKRIELAYDALKRHAHDLKTRKIPNAMAELGVTEFSLEDGTKIKVHDYVAGSLSNLQTDEEYDAAIEMIEKMGGASLIKTDVHLFFDKDERTTADEFVSGLREQGLSPEIKTGVHHSSLQSFVKELLKAGKNVDLTKLGLNSGKTAKINLPKAKVR